MGRDAEKKAGISHIIGNTIVSSEVFLGICSQLAVQECVQLSPLLVILDNISMYKAGEMFLLVLLETDGFPNDGIILELKKFAVLICVTAF